MLIVANKSFMPRVIMLSVMAPKWDSLYKNAWSNILFFTLPWLVFEPRIFFIFHFFFLSLYHWARVARQGYTCRIIYSIIAECHSCWLLQISPSCRVSLCWMSLCWVSWRPNEIAFTKMHGLASYFFTLFGLGFEPRIFFIFPFFFLSLPLSYSHSPGLHMLNNLQDWPWI